MNADTSDEFDDIIIPTYVINLKNIPERLNHILAEFYGKDEFGITVVDSMKHEIGPIGLWKSLVKIIKMALENDDDVIVIVEDNHRFTKFYNKNYLFKNLLEANDCNALILSGGNAGFDNVVPLSENRFWVDTFVSIQFLVLYKGVFEKILKYQFKTDDTAAGVLSGISSHKMLLFPFISQQHDFDHSEIATIHDQGMISDVFHDTQKRLSRIQDAYKKYVNTENPYLML